MSDQPTTKPDTGDQLPPHSTPAEAGILGCILIDPDWCWPLATDAIHDPRFFYDVRHQTIWETMKAMAADKKAIDPLTIIQRLKDRENIQEAGGDEYLLSLQDLAISTANLPGYIEIAHEKYTFRRIQISCSNVTGQIYNGSTGKEVALNIEAELAAMSIALNGKNGHLPKIVGAHEFVQVEIIPPPELIHGLLHRGTKMVLGGGSKSFKTWVLLDLGLSVAYRKPWLGHETAGGRVLFVNFEIQAAFFQQRLMQVAYTKGIKLNPNMIDIWNLRGYSAPYDKLVPEIAHRIKSEEYSLVILDPIYKLYGKTDENNASEVAQLLNTLENLCVTTGAAIAFGAHYSKGNQSSKESIDRISGSGVFSRDPDSILPFTRHEEEDCFTVEPILRNFPQIPPFVVRWQFPLMQRDDTLDPNKLKQSGGRPKEHQPGDLLALLPEAGLSDQKWQEIASQNRGISRSTFFRLKSELKSQNQIIFSRVDEVWKPLLSK